MGLLGSYLSRVPILFMVLTYIMAAGCESAGNREDAAPRPVVKVAVQAPLTGPFRSRGEAIIRGASMALEDKGQILKKAGLAVELVPYDEASPERAVANAELITDDSSIVGVIGHYDSAGAVPASERYHQASLPFIAVAATSPELTARGLSGIHRLPPRDDQQADALVATGVSIRARTAWVVHDRTLYGQGLSDLFKKGAETRGIRVLGYRGVERGQVTFEDVIAEIRRTQPDVVFFGGTFVEAGLLLKEMRDQGVRSAFIGGDGLDSPDFLALAGPDPGRVYFASLTYHVMESEAGRSWRHRYEYRHGTRPDTLSALAYDAAAIMVDAILHSASESPLPTRSGVALFLKEMPPYEGVSGRIAFDDKGDNRLAGESLAIFEMNRNGGQRIMPKKLLN